MQLHTCIMHNQSVLTKDFGRRGGLSVTVVVRVQGMGWVWNDRKVLFTLLKNCQMALLISVALTLYTLTNQLHRQMSSLKVISHALRPGTVIQGIERLTTSYILSGELPLVLFLSLPLRFPSFPSPPPFPLGPVLSRALLHPFHSPHLSFLPHLQLPLFTSSIQFWQ